MALRVRHDKGLVRIGLQWRLQGVAEVSRDAQWIACGPCAGFRCSWVGSLRGAVTGNAAVRLVVSRTHGGEHVLEMYC